MTEAGRIIVLAAGGTGGHVFPAQALAEELLARGRQAVLVTDRRGSDYGGALGQLPTHRISAGRVSGVAILDRVRGALELVAGFMQARDLLGRLAPGAVVGFGGYPALPTMLAATMRALPTVIHEQNAVLGRANRLVAGRVKAIAASFTETRFVGPKDQWKVAVTGNPVRQPVLEARKRSYPEVPTIGDIRLLVFGGSQGATVLSDVVPAALAELPADLRNRLEVTQQCRPEDLDRVEAVYGQTGIAATVAPFFDDVPDRLAASHLVISRSGASTVAELAVIGRPAILVPYAHATDDHQTANARALTEAGAAWAIPQGDFTATGLRDLLVELLGNPDQLAAKAAKAQAVGRPDAAAALADLVERLAPANGNSPAGHEEAAA